MNNGKRNQVSVFDYRDYRLFLRDWYRAAKEARNSFSYRAFSKRAGFQTSNFMMLVIQGKRNLTEESLKKFLLGLSLNKQEQDFFRNLVFFNQAKMHHDKNFYYQKLIHSKKLGQLKPIEKEQYEYYSTWYHPVVRELVVSRDFDGTPEWIAKKICPPITPVQAAKSIELLEKIGFIKRNGGGRWEQTQTILSTGPELTSVVVHNYHKSLLDLSKQVMDQLSLKHRDVSSLTLGVKRERLGELREKIREFRGEILKLVSTDIEPEEVVLLNMQLFPVTKVSQGNEKGDL